MEMAGKSDMINAMDSVEERGFDAEDEELAF